MSKQPALADQRTAGYDAAFLEAAVIALYAAFRVDSKPSLASDDAQRAIDDATTLLRIYKEQAP